MSEEDDSPITHQKTFNVQEKESSLIYISVLVVTLSGFLCGYGTVVLAGALQVIGLEFNISTVQSEIVFSSILLGAAFGAILGWPLCVFFGRKMGLFCAACLFIAAPIFLSLSTDYMMIVVGRFFLGIGIGLSTMSSLIYISEIAPANIRGSSVCILNFIYYLGAAVAYIIAWSLIDILAWRLMVILTLVAAIPFFILLFFIPETPQWYLSHKKREKAVEVLKKIRRKIEVENEVEILEESIEEAKGPASHLTFKSILRVFFIGLSVVIFMEAAGLDAILYYAPSILKLAGYASFRSQLVLGFGIALTSLVFSFVAILLIDIWGRRRLVLNGLIVMFVALVTVGFLFSGCQDCTGIDGWIIVSLLVFAAGFAVGIGTVGWLLISEIYPLKIRSFSVGITLCIKALANFVIARFFLTTLSQIGTHWTFWIYAGVSAVAFAFLYFFLPETSGKRLEDIEDLWTKELGYDPVL